MSESYESFARVYDELMDNVPYDEWTTNLVKILRQSGIENGLVCELGCGTGNVTERLARAGYDMIGVDSSYDMLAIAREKQYEADTCVRNILYLQQDMRAFELYGSVRAVVSLCDSLNYVLSPQELVTVFRLVNNYLDPGGIFVFDFNTEYKYRVVIGDSVIAENREDCGFIWENTYDEEARINEYDLTIFAREECEKTESGDTAEDTASGSGERFLRFCETHYQRGYTLEEMRSLLEQAGLVFETAVDVGSGQAPSEESERILVIAREQGKKQEE